MKIHVVVLFFGAISFCFCLDCEALNYGHAQDHSDGRVENTRNTFIDSLNRDRVKRNIDGNAALCIKENCTEKINHKYYVSEVLHDGRSFWMDIKGNRKTLLQKHLSDHYLKKATLKLSFKFPYYGHYLDRVVLTTGGFLYMDVYNTQLMTEVQYLAPLMAYFNSKLGGDSQVLTLDDGTKLTVQWRKVLLHNKTDVGSFNFQCTLHKNGTIWFAYKQVPVAVNSLSDFKGHPVRVGISDAFVIQRRDPEQPIIHRKFFIYSQVNITKKRVVNGSAVIFHPQKSCVIADSCARCMELGKVTEFSCQWCPATGRCSDGADRYRAEWENSGCSSIAVKKSSDERCAPKGTKSKGGIGAGAIFGICIVLVLVISIGAWCFYAYRYPTSKSGLFLIEMSRRPRELFNRGSSGSRGNTGAAAPLDVKPQVL
ncbi:plexin domain-containing protein 1-like [Montipora capricornis]|uniref:plexin domain-containing protein 1-like n=1 Tax=Montipora capricornis TaxID=246305 RepID=UPI0035F167FD